MTTEVYSRVCGYHRPVRCWNHGKREEFSDRAKFALPAPLPPRESPCP
jgi:ribonucleoside-triphosphate reductase